MNDNIILIILLASTIGSLWIYSKYYYRCKDKERESGEKLLPGGLWYFIFLSLYVFYHIQSYIIHYGYLQVHNDKKTNCRR